MSQLVGVALSPRVVLAPDDKLNGDEYFFGNEDLYFPSPYLVTQIEDEDEIKGFSNPWWPHGGNIMGGFDGVAENTLLQSSQRWGEVWMTVGCNGRLGFVGYTRDAYGSPIGNVTVRCFLTSTNELVSQVTSGANGFYIATTPYSGGHFLTVHKAGPPDIAGASIDSLTPA